MLSRKMRSDGDSKPQRLTELMSQPLDRHFRSISRMGDTTLDTAMFLFKICMSKQRNTGCAPWQCSGLNFIEKQSIKLWLVADLDQTLAGKYAISFEKEKKIEKKI